MWLNLLLKKLSQGYGSIGWCKKLCDVFEHVFPQLYHDFHSEVYSDGMRLAKKSVLNYRAERAHATIPVVRKVV